MIGDDSAPPPPREQEADPGTTRWESVAFVLLVLVVAAGAAVTVWRLAGTDDSPRDPRSLVVGQRAPGFALPNADGTTFELEDALARGDVLLYFSMGPG